MKLDKKYVAVMLSSTLSLMLLSGCGGSSSSIKSESIDVIDSQTPIADTKKESIFDSSLLLSSLSYEKSTRSQSQNSNQQQVRYDGELNFMGGCDTKDYILIDKPQNGDVTIYDNGFYTYKSDNFNGNDSFSYKTDINSTCPPVVVEVTNEVNQTLPSEASDLNITTTACEGTYEISWVDNSDNEDGFVLYLDDKPMKIVDKDTQTINLDLDLKEDVIYTLDIASKNSAGSSLSDTVKFKIVDSKVIIINEPIFLDKVSAAEKSWVSDTKLSKDEKIAYVVDFPSKLEFVDISDPTNPKVLNYFDDIQVSKIKISEDETKAFILGWSKFYIVDIRDIYNPKILSTMEFVNADYLALFDNDTKICITSDKFNGTNLGLAEFYDISDPSSPKLISSVDTEGDYPTYIKVSSDESKIYIPTSYTTFDVIDISDISNPKVVSKVDALKLEPWGDELLSLYDDYARDGNTLYVRYGDYKDGKVYYGVQIVDISDLNNRKLLGFIELNDVPKNLELSDDKTKLFVSNNFEGMLIYDVSAFH